MYLSSIRARACRPIRSRFVFQQFDHLSGEFVRCLADTEVFVVCGVDSLLADSSRSDSSHTPSLVHLETR
ncbi:hypothetical protein [Haladaptatus sp. NG-WS-4]